jgi:hypothetical protein
MAEQGVFPALITAVQEEAVLLQQVLLGAVAQVVTAEMERHLLSLDLLLLTLAAVAGEFMMQARLVLAEQEGAVQEAVLLMELLVILTLAVAVAGLEEQPHQLFTQAAPAVQVS